MKRKFQVILLAVIVAGIGAGLLWHMTRERRFAEQAFVQLRGGGGAEPVATIELGSGESAGVILEHACCIGAGFDAVAIRTSAGEEWFAKRNYCGLQGFLYELDEAASGDLSRFTAHLRGQGFSRW